MCVCVCVCVYVCMYVCMYIYIWLREITSGNFPVCVITTLAWSKKYFVI